METDEQVGNCLIMSQKDDVDGRLDAALRFQAVETPRVPSGARDWKGSCSSAPGLEAKRCPVRESFRTGHTEWWRQSSIAICKPGFDRVSLSSVRLHLVWYIVAQQKRQMVSLLQTLLVQNSTCLIAKSVDIPRRFPFPIPPIRASRLLFDCLVLLPPSPPHYTRQSLASRVSSFLSPRFGPPAVPSATPDSGTTPPVLVTAHRRKRSNRHIAPPCRRPPPCRFADTPWPRRRRQCYCPSLLSTWRP